MGKIAINTETVSGLKRTFKSKQSTCAGYSSRIITIKNNIDWRVLYRRGINTRLNSLQKRISRQTARLNACCAALDRTVQNMASADKQMQNEAKKIGYKLSRASSVMQIILNGGKSKRNKFITVPLAWQFFAGLFGGSADGAALSSWALLKNWFISADATDVTDKLFGTVGSSLELIDKIQSSDDINFSSQIVKYVQAVHKCVTGDYEDGWDITSAMLSLVKTSANTEKGLYDYFTKILEPTEGLKLYQSKGNLIGGVAVAGSVLGFAGSAIETVKKFNDESASISDKLADYVSLIGSGTGVIGGAYKFEKYGSMVIDKEKNKLVVENAAGLKNATAAITIVQAGFDAVSGGIKKYGDVTEDGNFNLADAGEVGVAVGVKGLVSIVPGGKIVEAIVKNTTGKDSDDLVDFITDKAKECGQNIGEAVIEMRDNGKEWLIQHPDVNSYVNDSSKSKVARTITATAVSIKASVEKGVESVKDKVNAEAAKAESVISGWFDRAVNSYSNTYVYQGGR